KPLQADYPDASVCARIARIGEKQVCIKLEEAASGASTGYVEVTGTDFEQFGLEVKVYEPGSPVPMARGQMIGKLHRQRLRDGLGECDGVTWVVIVRPGRR